MNFSELLKTKKVILLDGAMGTQLDEKGLMGKGENNLHAPQAVLEVHKEYIDCGCDMITTNTLAMNRIYIESHNVGVDVCDVNKAGVELAKKAVVKNQYVLGDISSTGQMLEPYGNYTQSQFYDNFREQAQILADAGIDGFIIETIFNLREALCALKACKDNFSLPIIVSIAFQTEDNGGRTIMGDSVRDCAKQLTDAGADVIGANCGDIDPFQMAEIISILKSQTSLPILAQPNAGKPKLIGGETIFEMPPRSFADGIRQCIKAGASIVGGCCGTTPRHIQYLSKNL